ncbi:PspA/IM30 family protein [Mastigocoleus testarum]|uniref:Phage shock protein A n=1 Tax=Mastigocoleus testarum BC008 TaxID=371196 RepID=A0A0V7ZFK6_9CYAN|nr:PspA/IM30 family protein [Mastigocoleus testarum]KST63305.1 phage shock protein A [Mastigocoleus testarum BC008]
MGLIDRILRVLRANINSLIKGAEDPEKILEQTVKEMQDNLVQLRQGVAQAIATQKRTERQAAQTQSTSEEWYRRAQLALQQGNESLAREALTKRKAYQDTAKELFNHIDSQKTVVAKLKKNMQSLEIKISEAKTKKDMYIARARSAQASYRLQEMLGDLTGEQSAFERMEEKILGIEAQSEAASVGGNNELEQKFAALEKSKEIDSELTAMKQQLADGMDKNNER